MFTSSFKKLQAVPLYLYSKDSAFEQKYYGNKRCMCKSSPCTAAAPILVPLSSAVPQKGCKLEEGDGILQEIKRKLGMFRQRHEVK